MFEGFEVVCKCLGMYIGLNGLFGFMYCFWEIIDNLVDEVVVGNGMWIDIILYVDGSVEVYDCGCGILVDVELCIGFIGVEVVYMKFYVGGKFGGGFYVVFGGLYGVGVLVVNVLFECFDVEVDCGGKIYVMLFYCGELGIF